HLFREDLLRQAISRNFAYLTGRWGDSDTVTTTPLPEPDLLDPHRVDDELETLANEDRGWRVFLARNGLTPISISYEQLCGDPSGFVAMIARRVGIDPRTLRQGYSEPVAPSGLEDPALPTKGEVARQYFANFRKIEGAPIPEVSSSTNRTSVS